MTNKIEQAILQRKSVRKYSNIELEKDILEKVKQIINQNIETPFGNKSTFYIVEKKDSNNEKLKLGTYGFISGAKYFIVGKCSTSKTAFYDYGFALEKIILDLTNLDLGTCWLGGTFKRSEFEKAIDISTDELIPAISPFGIPKTSLKNGIIRSAIKANKRKPFESLFYKENTETPLIEDDSLISKALEMLRWSPSADNFQPWRVIVNDAGFHFYINRSKVLSKMAKTIDLQKVDLGIAMCHFEQFLAENNIIGKWMQMDMHAKSDKFEYAATWKM